MNTPIYDSLVEQLDVLTESADEPVPAPEARGAGTDYDVAPEPHPLDAEYDEAEVEAPEPVTACYWCGVPVWAESERYDWTAVDPAGGESVLLTACSPAHLARLQAARGHDPAAPDEDAVSDATKPLSLPAPSAPPPAPPALDADLELTANLRPAGGSAAPSGDTEPICLPAHRLALPVEPDDDEFAGEPVQESALIGPKTAPVERRSSTDLGLRAHH